MLSQQPLTTEPDEGEEQCMSGYEDDLCTQPVDPRPLAGKFSLWLFSCKDFHPHTPSHTCITLSHTYSVVFT